MLNQTMKRILRLLSVSALTAVAIASVDIPSYSAPPSSEQLENTTSELQSDLNDMNSQLADLSAELDNTSEQIEQLSAEVEKAKLDLAAAQLNEESQYNAMKNRIKFMYEGGNISLLEILFSSDDMSDFLNKAEYVTTISEYDRSMLEEFQETRVKVEDRQAELIDKQEELAALQNNLQSQKDTLTAKISSTSSKLEDYKDQLERARIAEEASKTAQNNEVSGSITPVSSKSKKTGSTSSETTNVGATSSTTTDVALLAALLECEAGGYDGMLAVATVVMNRVESPRYPNTLRGVIYQSGQFSPAWNGRLERVLSRGPSSTAYAVAQAALNGERYSAVIDCYSFHAAGGGDSGVNVGGNVFF